MWGTSGSDRVIKGLGCERCRLAASLVNAANVAFVSHRRPTLALDNDDHPSLTRPNCGGRRTSIPLGLPPQATQSA